MPSGGKLPDSTEDLPVPKTFPGSWVGNLPDFLATVSENRRLMRHDLLCRDAIEVGRK
jgi:hypothetical protein